MDPADVVRHEEYKAGPVGVDIGSYKTVLSCFHRNGPEVVPAGDKDGDNIKTIVAYTDYERKIGYQALQLQIPNLSRTM